MSLDELLHLAGVDALAIEQLRSFGGRPAVIDGSRTVSYDELAELVIDRVGSRLAQERRVDVIVAERTLGTIVEFLAALELGNPIVLANDAASASELTERFGGAIAAQLHPDLALLMSTSGTTGASKLVRLSKRAVATNAIAIADSLRLDSADRAITALPLHYCYGLSVLTSHLAVGAAIVLTDAAVVDPCFWDAVDQHGVTGIAGVPYTFELLARQRATGIERLDARSLRYVTQAGGRLEPEAVAELVRLGDLHEFNTYVMYGQTEATARMAVLEPDDARQWPASVGRAIAGGSIELHPVEDVEPGIGEIVYRGPNVMMGYATSVDDLERGHDLTELHTGDLARHNSAGLLEIVGRANRIVKVHGLRTDLDQLEDDLAAVGVTAHCSGDDSGLVVARLDESLSTPEADAELRAAAAELVAVPTGRICTVVVPEWPRTPSGKVDRPALTTAARRIESQSSEQLVDTEATSTSVRDTFELLIAPTIDPDRDSFASLGGDSFSYVEMSIRLESVIGALPADWHLRTVRDLSALADQRASAPPSRWARLDTSVVIRAVAILMIVCTHMGLYRLPGGAHTLLLVVGYNVARFQIGSTGSCAGRLRQPFATAAKVAVPTMAWIGTQMVLFGGYSLGALFLVNNYFGSPWRRDGRWEYWYFETFVQALIVIGLLFAIPAVRRAEGRAPFGFALLLVACTLLFRFEIVAWGDPYNAVFRPHTVACFIALGWAAQRASSATHRLTVTALLGMTAIGYFGQVDREWRIILFGAALIWLPSLPIPRRLVGPVGVVAAASMYIFLVHWQAWPMFTPWLERHVAFVATILTGVATWWCLQRLASVAPSLGRIRQHTDTGRDGSAAPYMP